MELNKLKVELGAESIDFKPTNVTKSKQGVSCQLLAYKDARVDMDMLDEAVGQENWQNEYRRDSNGVLQCGIGICLFDDFLKKWEWVWKWSNGTPSDYEKEKGEYSDAFKRAGFMWGIGRTLYNFPQITVWLKDGEWYEDKATNKVKISSFRFKPNDWKWTISKDYKNIEAKEGDAVRFSTNKPPEPQTKGEKVSNIAKRYDALLIENKGLFDSQEIVNWSRSSSWDEAYLVEKGKELKELITERIDQLAYENQ